MLSPALASTLGVPLVRELLAQGSTGFAVGSLAVAVAIGSRVPRSALRVLREVETPVGERRPVLLLLLSVMLTFVAVIAGAVLLLGWLGRCVVLLGRILDEEWAAEPAGSATSADSGRRPAGQDGVDQRPGGGPVGGARVGEQHEVDRAELGQADGAPALAPPVAPPVAPQG